jgi:uncharacterized protein (DUF2141 family)
MAQHETIQTRVHGFIHNRIQAKIMKMKQRTGMIIALSIVMMSPVLAKPPTPIKVKKPIPVKPLPATKASTPVPAKSDSSETGSSLDVQFSDLKNPTGKVCVSLFSGPKGFPKGGSDSDLSTSRCEPLANGSATFLIPNLKPGDYAISTYHDANADGKMNKSAFGMPEEGFGFSNNPSIGFSAPSFDETKFKVSGPKTMVKIQMKYMN